MRLASLGLAALLALPAGAASAQYYAPGWERADRTGSVAPGYARRPPPGVNGGYSPWGMQTCVPWCRYDYNPCDPPGFKIADGRCHRPR